MAHDNWEAERDQLNSKQYAKDDASPVRNFIEQDLKLIKNKLANLSRTVHALKRSDGTALLVPDVEGNGESIRISAYPIQPPAGITAGKGVPAYFYDCDKHLYKAFNRRELAKRIDLDSIEDEDRERLVSWLKLAGYRS